MAIVMAKTNIKYMTMAKEKIKVKNVCISLEIYRLL